MNDLIERKEVIEITAETGALETQARVKRLPTINAIPVEKVQGVIDILQHEINLTNPDEYGRFDSPDDEAFNYAYSCAVDKLKQILEGAEE